MGKSGQYTRALSDLEAAVLGTIAREQPITAYGVRVQFSESMTTRWSTSGGSIYPAVRRLVERELVEARPRRDDRRDTVDLSITTAGTRALGEWVSSSGESENGVPFDPLRARLQFVALIPEEDRLGILKKFHAEQLRLLERVRAVAAADEQKPFTGEVMRCVVEIVEARVRLAERLQERQQGSGWGTDR